MLGLAAMRLLTLEEIDNRTQGEHVRGVEEHKEAYSENAAP